MGVRRWWRGLGRSQEWFVVMAIIILVLLVALVALREVLRSDYGLMTGWLYDVVVGVIVLLILWVPFYRTLRRQR